MEGHQVGMPITATDVVKVLASVRQMVLAGNRVVFDAEERLIEHKETGKRTRLKLEDSGAYTFEMKVPSGTEEDAAADQGFQRQAGLAAHLSQDQC